MLKRLLCYSQYLLPQHLITRLIGRLANSKDPWLKNRFIDFFCRHYQIDFSEAEIQNPHAYASFNDFFTRSLKPGARPVDMHPDIFVSPADGVLAEYGQIRQQQLLQAKNMYFNLTSLLAGQHETAALFADGHFATIYLAPHNYHRVHMPIAGKLRQSIYIPGNLFSVNRMTSSLIPNLYARNERLVMIFDTHIGPVALILVGALIVGSMQTVWMDAPIRSNKIEIHHPEHDIQLEKGAELGRFLLGSTVIVLLPNIHLTWEADIRQHPDLRYGQNLARLDLN